jgi:glycosyltransferase involved in cell wall biosynthesis
MPTERPTTPIPVVRIITRLNIGGPSIQATRLSALDRGGFSTTLIHGRLGEGEGDMSYLIAPGTRAVYVDTLRRPLSPLSDLRAWLRLIGELRRARPQIVHTHMAKAGLLGRLAAGVYNLTRGGAPRAKVIHTYHGHVLEGYFTPLMTRVFIGFEQLVAHLTDALIAISPTIERDLRDHFHIGRPSQYRVIPLGFDLTPFAEINHATRVRARMDLHLAADADVVCTVGRLTPIKQHRLFLDTVALVAAARPGLIALIAGDGELRADLERYAAELGIADRVHFLGWRRDLATIYAASDVFLLTSRNEGTPVALIEAMAAGIPGVSTDVGGVKDVIVSDDVGARVESSADALATHVLRYLADPELRRQSGARARGVVIDRFGLERLVHDVRTLYLELLSRP